MSAVETANDVIGTKEAAPFRWWWAAAAAAVIAAVSISVPLMRREEPLARIIRYAPADARAVETRLTPFTWAPYRGPMRDGEAPADARHLQLAGAAGDAVARANGDPSAEAQWTAGVALLLVDQPEQALTRLRAAVQRAPNDAAMWSDLAAAFDAAAIRLDRKSLHAEALAAADRALAIDGSHAGALFNRALILEHLGLRGDAREAWNRYLAVDPASPWANEAREHLRRLPASTGDARFRAAQSRLAQVGALVPEFPQQSRSYGEGIYLGRWGASGDTTYLDAARTIGAALFALSGESLLRDSVRAVDTATGERRVQLAAAHALYDRARLTLSRHEPLAAERDLREAATGFERGGSPMALVARYFAACARFESGDVAGAREELEHLLAGSELHPHWIALRAQIAWQLATIAFADADWTGALERLRVAEQLFRKLGEQSNLAFVRGMESTAMGCLGRPDEAWAARIEAFRVLDAEGQADRLPVNLGGAARMELHAGRLDTAQAFLQLEVQAVREQKSGAQLANALVRETLLQVKRGDPAAAEDAAREAMKIASSLPAPGRDVAIADASLAAGAAAVQSEPASARGFLTTAIGFYRASGRMLFLPQAHLLRARAALRGGDREMALRDLEEGMDVLDRHRQPLAGPLAGTDILDAGAALAEEALRLQLERGDVAAAFRDSERSHLRSGAGGASPVSLDELQRRLHGTGSAVLMLSLLPREVVAITIDATHVAVARTPLDEETLDARIRGAIEGQREDAIALYDALVRPSHAALPSIEHLIVVADPLLQEVPYAALYDRIAGRHLIEEMSIATAESASSLQREPAPARPLAVVVALPSGGLEPLPDAQRELEDVTALYRQTIPLDPASVTFDAFAHAASRAGIVHVAGHTSRQRGVNERALPFGRQRATWRDLSALRLGSSVVVILAACETLCRPDVRRTSGRSLGGGALAAGAGNVIGTLAPIADRDAAELFLRVHRGLAAGMSAADALRRAQLDAVAAESATGRRSPWRAIALLTRNI